MSQRPPPPPARATAVPELADAVATEVSARVARMVTPPFGVPQTPPPAPPAEPRSVNYTHLILALIGTLITMGAAMIAATATLLDRIGDRAPAAKVEELEQRQEKSDRAQAVQDMRLDQITTAVGQLSADVKTIDHKVGEVLDEVRPDRSKRRK